MTMLIDALSKSFKMHRTSYNASTIGLVQVYIALDVNVNITMHA